MMVIVESTQEFLKFKEKISIMPVLIIPVYSDIFNHSYNNRISFLYCCFFDKEECGISYHHNDMVKIDKTLDELLTPNKKIYIYNKKRFLYHYKNSTLNDVDLINYFHYNHELETDPFETVAHEFLSHRLSKIKNINDVIPFTKHYEKCVQIKDKFFQIIESQLPIQSYQYYNDLVINILYNIEKNGLFVDYNKFLQVFGQTGLEHNLTFTEYNIYTTTGRPSNRFSGINYAALNKEDGSRTPFISRFEKNGLLLNFDFESYHLRLIAELIGYSFPKDINVHEYLGKQYFKTGILTEQQRNESKGISFRQLYGGVQQEYQHIPYFQKEKELIDSMWHEFKQIGYIKTKLFERPLYARFFEDMNRNKLFNYYLQNLETERNISILHELMQYFEKVKAKSKIVLYEYDSIILDYCMDDGKELIIQSKKILEQSGKFPVKLKIGNNFHEMKEKRLF